MLLAKDGQSFKPYNIQERIDSAIGYPAVLVGITRSKEAGLIPIMELPLGQAGESDDMISAKSANDIVQIAHKANFPPAPLAEYGSGGWTALGERGALITPRDAGPERGVASRYTRPGRERPAPPTYNALFLIY